jgi:hypothetical protein
MVAEEAGSETRLGTTTKPVERQSTQLASRPRIWAYELSAEAETAGILTEDGPRLAPE